MKLRPVELIDISSDGKVGSCNMLIRGDNRLVMEEALAHYSGKIDLIYIDLPYGQDIVLSSL